MAESELEADTVVILSSELISKIVGEYFNKKMFKESVEIVDLKPAEAGYMFSIAFVKKVIQATVLSHVSLTQADKDLLALPNVEYNAPVRAKNGQFTKVGGGK